MALAFPAGLPHTPSAALAPLAAITETERGYATAGGGQGWGNGGGARAAGRDRRRRKPGGPSPGAAPSPGGWRASPSRWLRPPETKRDETVT